MNKTYIRNATEPVSSRRVDICLQPNSHGAEHKPELWEGIHSDIIEILPAGEMEIPAGARVIDAQGKLILPALFDLHSHIEIEGRSKRESVSRAGQAALHGGVWAMLVMPDKGFCFDNADKLDSFHDAVSQRSAVEMIPAGCISQNMEGEQQAPYNTLAARGVSILSDGEHVPSNILMLHRAMKYAAELDLCFAIRGDVPALTEKTYMQPSSSSYRLGLHGSPACAEEIGIETLVRLAKDAGVRLHVQSVSTAEGVAIIRRAKEEGVRVTAEAALHHLLYTHADVGDYDTNFKTIPPLRDAADCEALLLGIREGVIDCIVSEHTPCLPFAKKQDFISAPQGMVWLDILLPALYSLLVKSGKLSWAELIQACCAKPAAIAAPQDEEGNPAATPLLLFDPEASCPVSEETLACGTLNSPLLGQTLQGSVTMPL